VAKGLRDGGHVVPYRKISYFFKEIFLIRPLFRSSGFDFHGTLKRILLHFYGARKFLFPADCASVRKMTFVRLVNVHNIMIFQGTFNYLFF